MDEFRAFDHIRTPEKWKAELFDKINGSPEKGVNRCLYQHTRHLSLAVVIVAVIALLCTAVFAAGGFTGLVTWFNDIWRDRTGTDLSEMQIQTIEGMTKEVGQSVTADGITVTAQSVFVGESEIQILFTASSSGTHFKDNVKYTFSDFEARIEPNPIGEGAPPANCFSIVSYKVDETENVVYFVLEYSATVPPGNSLQDGGYAVTIELNDLISLDEGSTVVMKYSGEDVSNAGAAQSYGGEWSFSFPLPAAERETSLRLEDVVVQTKVYELKPGETSYGITEEIELHDITVTSGGISFTCEYQEGYHMSFRAAAILSDGTEIADKGGGGEINGTTWRKRLLWLSPVDIEELAAVKIENQVIEIP